MSEFKRSLAIVIGINNYQNGINRLKTAVPDAVKIATILKNSYQYQLIHPNFDTGVIVNQYATNTSLKSLFTDILPDRIKPTQSDRLLLYFAGHGIALNGDDGPQGYLIPQDAKLGDVSTYLSMQMVEAALTKLSCRHCLIILDCCFAGAFRWSSTRKLVAITETIHKERYDRFIQDSAWQVITSAASDQYALDNLDIKGDRGIAKNNTNHSPFASALISALSGAADAYPTASNGKPSGDGVITAMELYMYLRDSVEIPTDDSNQRQTPGIWFLKKHDKGEFIFLTPGHPLNLPPAPPLDELKNPYRGLESFEEEHSALFFGRIASIEKLYQFVNSRTLTVVLGASGSGKSSLVKAGLVPYLKQQLEVKSNQQWQILAPFRPGESPLKALNNTLARENLAGNSITQLGIEEKVATLSANLANWSQQHPNTKMLLVVDQFEEARLLVTGLDTENQAYVEPVHDALVTGWRKLLVWKQEEEESLPLQRRLTPAAEEWNSIKSQKQPSGFQAKAEPLINWLDEKFYLAENFLNKINTCINTQLARLWQRTPNEQKGSREKPLQFLWNANPYLDVLDKELNSDDNWLNQIEVEFVQQSVRQKYRNARLLRGSVTVVVISAIVAAIIFNILRETAQKNEIRSLVTSTGALYLSNQELDAFVQGLTAETKLKPLLPWAKADPQSQALVQMALIQLVYGSRERNLLEGHTDKVNDVSFSPDGKTIASVSNDGTIRLWGLNGKPLTPPFSAKDDAGCDVHILSLSFSPDSQTIAATDDFNNIKLLNWDGKQLKSIKSMKHKWDGGQSEQCTYYDLPSIKSVSFARDGTIASADNQGIINLWSRDGQLLKTLPGHKESVNSVSFSPDGQTIASADNQGIINLWSRDGFLQGTFKVHDHPINNVSFSPDGQTIASADDQGIVKLWSRDAKLLATLPGHNGSINDVSFSPDGQTIATGGNDRTIKLWSRDGKLLATLPGHNGSVNSVSFSPNGQTIVTGSDDRTIRLWSRDVQPVRTLKGFSVSFSPDGTTIISTDKEDEQSIIKLWNRESEPLKHFSDPQFKDIFSGPTPDDMVAKVDISPDGTMLTRSIYVKKSLFNLCQSPLFGYEPNGIKLWSQDDQPPTILHVNNAIVSDVSFSPDSQTIATATDDGIVILWNRDGQKIGTLPVDSNLAEDVEFDSSKQESQYSTVCGGDKQNLKSLIGVSDVSFSPDGLMITSSYDDGNIKLWSPDGQLVKTLEKHDGSINSVNFSPDGQIIASSDDKGIVKLWSRDGKPVRTFQGHDRSINSVNFSPDSQIIATASNDGNVKLWSRDGQLQATLQGTDGPINNVSFSSDGKTLAAASKKGTIILWTIELDNLLTLSCDRARNYLHNNPNVSESDRDLCDDVPVSVQPPVAKTPFSPASEDFSP